MAAIIGGTVVSTSASIGNKPNTEKPAAVQTQAQTTVKTPKIETKTVSDAQVVAFSKTSVEDNAIEKGTSRIRTTGVNGVKTITYQITLTDGVQTDKKVLGEEVTTSPVTEVTAIGTYVKPKSACDPNYSGACVPIASDVDCAGGSGNGPAYVRGPVYVIGSDIYGLDRDGNGVGCE